MTAVTIALVALVFGAAAWSGTLIAEFLCAGIVPYADGPQPLRYRRALFAVAGGVFGVALAVRAESSATLALLVVVVIGLAGCTAADLACGLLPDVLTLAPLGIVVGAGAVLHNWMPALSAALACSPFAAFALVTRGRGMGWGDVKLAALGGALLGAGGATLAFGLAAAAACAVAKATGGGRRPVAFGPYLATSIAATLAVVRMP